MVQGECFTSIKFLLIVLFISCLNSSTNTLSSKLLPLTAVLNSYTNSSIILLSYSTNPLLNSIFKSAKKSLTNTYLIFPLSRSSITFFFQISTNSPCIYDNTHCICSSTNVPLIFIWICGLQAIRNPDTLPISLLNICSLATSTFDLVLGLGAALLPIATICACNTATCFYKTAA